MHINSFTIPSNKTEAENIETLKGIVFTEPLRWFYHIGHFKGKLFWGSVTGNTFKVMPVIAGRNSFLPVIKGEITPGNLSIVVIKMRPHYALIALFAFVTLFILATMLQKPDNGGFFVLPVVYIISALLYQRECKKVRLTLQGFFK